LPGTVVTEFTPGQLVIGVCVMLFFAVLCFGAGILVGRNDPSLNTLPPADLAAATPATTAPLDSIPAPPPAAGRGMQQSPRTPDAPTQPQAITLPPIASNAPPTAAAEIPVKLETQPTPELPPVVPPANTQPANTPAPAPITAPAPATEKSAALAPIPAPDASKTATTPKPADPKAGALPAIPPPAPKAPAPPVLDEDDLLAQSALEPIAAKKAPQPKSATAPPATAPPAATPPTPKSAASGGSGAFGIQIGAFPGPNRESQANDLLKRTQAAGFSAEVRTSKDKQYYRVVITGYRDRASAVKALESLKQRPGYDKAFIQDLSKL